MILALLYLLLAFLVGWLAVSLLRLKTGGVEHAALGAAFGFAIAAPTSFAFVILLGLPWGLLAWIVIAAAALVLLRAEMGVRFEWKKLEMILLALAVALSIFALVKEQLDYSEGSHWVGRMAFNDVMLHNAMVSSFAFGRNFPPQEPFLSGIPLHYHFMVDFFSGMLRYGGMGFREAFLLPEVLLLAGLMLLIYFISLRLTGRKAAALFAVGLFLLNGNLSILEAYINGPTTDLEKLGAGIGELYGGKGYWGSDTVLATIMPLRALLAGLPLFAAGLLLLAIGLQGKKNDERALAGAGAIAGLSPLVHGFAFPGLAICGFILICLFSKEKVKGLAFFFVPALLLAAPQFLFIFSTGTPHGYPRFNFLYMADNIPDALLVWIRNWGPFLALLLPGIALADGRMKAYYLAPLALFALVNLVQYQPFEVDNQIIFLWYLASVPVAASFLALLWGKGKVGALVALLLFAAATLSGVVSVYHNTQSRFAVFPDSHFEFADWLVANTPPDAVVLTAQVHTHPASVLAGRKMVVGVYAYAVGRGLAELTGLDLDYDGRVRAVREIYEGGAGAEEGMRKYGVDYVVVGPHEVSSRELAVNEEFFSGPLFEKVYDRFLDGERWRVYRAR